MNVRIVNENYHCELSAAIERELKRRDASLISVAESARGHKAIKASTPNLVLYKHEKEKKDMSIKGMKKRNENRKYNKIRKRRRTSAEHHVLVEQSQLMYP